MTTHYDAIIIGAGQAGPSLAVRLADSGMKVAIVERNLFGGTCVNTGCIPTKTLVASAYTAHLARRSSDYGVITDQVTVDMKKIHARKEGIVAKSNQGIESWLRNTKNCTVYEGHATFKSPNTISVNDEFLQAEKIFINVGARPFVPPIPGTDTIDYLTSSTILDVDFLPDHLIIIGGSYIGLEFAQMYRRFGSKVSVIEKVDRLIPREDEDISEEIKKILEAEGIEFYLNTECMSMEKNNDKVVVKVECDDPSKEVIGSHVLLAVGRKPNTDDLALENAGVNVDERGIVLVDEKLQTNVPNIWALGECNGRGAFTHTSYNDYEIVADNLLDGKNRQVSDRILTYGLFIDPPLARAGMTEAQVRESGKAALINTRPMARVGRAVEKGETQGFMKVLVDAKTKEILGAAILGISGDEAIHCILDVMYSKKPYTVITHAVHIHPTVSELIPTLFGELKALT